MHISHGLGAISPELAAVTVAPARLGDPAAVAVERAVAELRAGRPVCLTQTEGPDLAVLPLDTATPASYAMLQAVAEPLPAQLYLTQPRAKVLGLADAAPSGVLLPAASLTFEGACRIAYGEAAPDAATAQPAPASAVAAAALARLGLLLPALLLRPLADDDASGLRAACLSVTVAQVEAARVQSAGDWTVLVRTPVPLAGVGSADFVVFRGGLAARDQVAIVVGTPDLSRPVPVRVHSSCLTGDLFGSLKCDCGDQLRGGIAELHKRGGGVLLYLDQEGRGTGIAAKMRAYGFQNMGLDTVDADAKLGFGLDERSYEAAVAMLRALGIETVELLSNNPAKQRFLEQHGIAVVGRSRVLGTVNAHNRNYLRTKAARAQHDLPGEMLEG